MAVTTKPRTSRSAGRPPRKNPLRIATSAEFGPFPAFTEEPSSAADAPRAVPGRVISSADLRTMRISEFSQWLGGQTNLHHFFKWLERTRGWTDPWKSEDLVRYGPGKKRPTTLATEYVSDLLAVTGGGNAQNFDDASRPLTCRPISSRGRSAASFRSREHASSPTGALSSPRLRRRGLPSPTSASVSRTDARPCQRYGLAGRERSRTAAWSACSTGALTRRSGAMSIPPNFVTPWPTTSK
jgi:hypothetical protein